jgi:hypothetical protein
MAMSPYCIFEMLDACAESPKGREVSVVSAQFYFFLVGEHQPNLPFRQEVCRLCAHFETGIGTGIDSGFDAKPLY